MRGSPSAVEISAIDFRVRFGNPLVHLEMTASDLPILRARSLCVIFFCLRIVSIRAMISADNCTSVIISGVTAANFSLNQSCLLLVFKALLSSRSLYYYKDTNINLTYKLIFGD